MTRNEEELLLTLTKDNNKLLCSIWTLLSEGSPNDDFKDFTMNMAANLIANKIEQNKK